MGINFQNVEYKYPNSSNLALKGLNLEISKEDEFIFLVGKTGSGKSTLLQLTNTLLLPTKGYISIKDRDIVTAYTNKLKLNTKNNQTKYNIKSRGLFLKVPTPIYNKKLKDLRSHVGLVFQFPEYQLFESTVLKDVMFGPKNFGLNEKEALQQAKKALKEVGLEEYIYNESPFNLSGGQMRKVALAGILAMNPDILMLDEPTVGLDPVSKQELLKTLVDLNYIYHKTIIIVSHDMDLVAQYAKRVIVLAKGEKVFDGAKEKLFNNKEFLQKYHLDLPYAAKIAEGLRSKKLISYDSVPLNFKELKKIILGVAHE